MADTSTDALATSILDALDTPAGADNAAGSDEDRALQILDGGDAAQGQEAGETASDETTEAVEAETQETEPPIDPPVSWKAEGKDKFKALPRDLQQIIAERESERERGLTKSQQESADRIKAVDAQSASMQDERRAYTDRLNVLVEMAHTMDPVIAKGQNTDWALFAQEDPIGAFQARAAYDQRLTQIDALVNERDKVQQRMTADQLSKANERLTRELDFWADNDKRAAFQSEIKTFLGKHDYRPEELDSITDPRAIVLARKAMLYDKLMAQQTNIADHKKTPAPGKTVRVQANETSTGINARAEALKRTAIKTNRVADSVNAILAAL